MGHDTNAVRAFVERLANPPVRPPSIAVGVAWTGRREVLYDTRKGTYSECKPTMDEWARWLQAALLPPLTRRRNKKKVRQPA